MNRILYVLLSLLAPLALGAQPLPPALVATLDSLALQDVPPGAPGIAVGIVQRGEIVYQRVAGWAQLPEQVPLSPQSRFNIASNGKQFTALAILQLARAGRLNLGDDLRQYFPRLYPGITAPITLRHLLTHSSGIRDVYALWQLQGYTWWQEAFTNQDALTLLAAQEDLNFAPGEGYRYSNSNYILLAEIVAQVSGQSFAAYTQGLFASLGMPATAFEAGPGPVTGPVAAPYFNFDTWTTYDWSWQVCGDGNLFSSLADQLRWEQILQQPGRAPGLDAELLAESQAPVAGATVSHYGYGVEISAYRGRPCVFHEGATGAWKAVTLRFPAQQLAIVTLTNSGKTDPARQSRQMADVLLGLPPVAQDWATPPPPRGEVVPVDSILGVYQEAGGTLFRFVWRDSALYLLRAGRNDVQLARGAGDRFYQVYDPTFQQVFARTAAGGWQVTAYHPTHAPYTLTLVRADWAGFDPRARAGRYHNRETGVRVRIRHAGGRDYQLQMGRNRWPGLLLTPTRMMAGGYQLDFEAETASDFRLQGDRVRQVHFRRRP